jgi:phospholipase D1/2
VLGCYLGAGLVVFPVLLLMIACAAVFGPWLGIAYSCAGLLASASLNYGIGAWLGREMVRTMLGRRFGSARAALTRRGLITVAVVRVIPGSPFALVSVAAGTSDIRFWDYFIGTAIGIMVPVVIMSVATERASRMLREPSLTHFAVLAGVIALWIGVAFGAQAILERIAKGQTRDVG